jgi:hypothetical protein
MKLARMNAFDVQVATRLELKPPARDRVRRIPSGWILVRRVAWVGLALFFTAGFAFGLSVYGGRSALDPGPFHACILFFAWCALLLGPTWDA